MASRGLLYVAGFAVWFLLKVAERVSVWQQSVGRVRRGPQTTTQGSAITSNLRSLTSTSNEGWKMESARQLANDVVHMKQMVNGI